MLLKHMSQFTEEENWYIDSVVRKHLKFKKFCRHADYRYHNKGVYQYFSVDDIKRIINDPRKGYVFEVRYIPKWGKKAEERYVFRSRYAVHGMNLVLILKGKLLQFI